MQRQESLKEHTTWATRRQQLELLFRIKEVSDRVVVAMLVLLLASLLINRAVDISQVLEAVIRQADLGIAALAIVYGIVRYCYLKPAVSPVPTRDDCKVLREWLRGGAEPKSQSRCSCRFATEEVSAEITALDYEGFGTSAFAVERAKLLERNTNWIKRNPKIFMFIFNPLTTNKDVIGYSCLVPLNTDGARLYWEGKIKDEDIPPALIARPREAPHAVVICAVMLKREFSYTRGRAAREFTWYFIHCVRHHLVNLCPQLYKKGSFPDLYAQTEQRSIFRRLLRMGFTKTDRMSAEGYRLLLLERPFRKT